MCSCHEELLAEWICLHPLHDSTQQGCMAVPAAGTLWDGCPDPQISSQPRPWVSTVHCNFGSEPNGGSH